MFITEGARAEVTQRRGRRATDAAVVPWTLPTTMWWLSEVETQQVICFWTVLFITHHQLSSLSTTETEVLMSVLSLWSQLPLLGLQLGIFGLLLFFHY